jgi:hypothetical protein
MVTRIEKVQTTSAPSLKLAGRSAPFATPLGGFRKIAHTGQEFEGGRPSSVIASILLRERLVASRLDERRRLRLAYLQRQSELSMSFVVDVDAQLLTGDLDQDISILDIVA